ncbi:hypothetical protein [Aquibacillus rhizosphaerae]|uniref:Uncharacterized protein n=1 Tax=Aquibacillus rhizosphaerae TaxID=3051431 RepID=A0ABT7L3D2_9BACI|nr:hypothetical protein [Aquibacillus sp. LR5S19]MDL4840354.1 hypothetical protein [Aquibacillus sp. LR5S19]
MNKLLDCTSIVTIYESLEEIIGPKIRHFVRDHRNRFSLSKHGIVNFDRVSIEEIKHYFKVSTFDYNEIVVHHAASIISQDSYKYGGLYNLKTLAKKTNNSFKDFLLDNGISFKLDSEGYPFFEYKDKRVTSRYLELRYKKDSNINGFLFSYSLKEDTNIDKIRLCPEIIKHLGEVVGLNLKAKWEAISVPSGISFKTNLFNIHKDTFGFECSLYIKQEHFIKYSLDYLLIFDAIRYEYPKDHPMIFLKADQIVEPKDILSIKTLGEVE